jgi:hypothetical protein
MPLADEYFGAGIEFAMKRIAVFRNAGGGKSTLAGRLVAITGLPLYIIDTLQFKEGGAAVHGRDAKRCEGVGRHDPRRQRGGEALAQEGPSRNISQRFTSRANQSLRRQ